MGGLFGFIAEIPARDFGYFIAGSVELLGYYLASLLIVSLSFCNMSAVRAAAVCLLLDMAFCWYTGCFLSFDRRVVRQPENA